MGAARGASQSFERSGIKLFPALRAEELTGPAAQLAGIHMNILKAVLQIIFSCPVFYLSVIVIYGSIADLLDKDAWVYSKSWWELLAWAVIALFIAVFLLWVFFRSKRKYTIRVLLISACVNIAISLLLYYRAAYIISQWD